MSEELLPCPFCGSKATTDFAVGCTSCHAVVPNIAIWNRRAQSPQVAALVKAAIDIRDTLWVYSQSDGITELECEDMGDKLDVALRPFVPAQPQEMGRTVSRGGTEDEICSFCGCRPGSCPPVVKCYSRDEAKEIE